MGNSRPWLTGPIQKPLLKNAIASAELPETCLKLSKPKMPSFDSYNAKTTSISYPWPKDVNGVERIALSAQGDLQRVLSAFFSLPIIITLVYSQTVRQAPLQSAAEPITNPSPSIIASVSPNSPIIQTRQVHLQCSGKIVCTATSTVRITSPECADLFLREKYAIGQMFRRLQQIPAFDLLAVGLGPVDDNGKMPDPFSTKDKESNQLWRKYTLTIPNFECEILEVFPSRDMFRQGNSWLTGEYAKAEPSSEALTTLTEVDRGATFLQGLSVVLALGLFLLVGFEIAIRHGGHLGFC